MITVNDLIFLIKKAIEAEVSDSLFSFSSIGLKKAIKIIDEMYSHYSESDVIMNAERIKSLEKKVAEFEAKQKAAVKWQTFGAFTAENRISRTRLNTLIAQGRVVVDKQNRAHLYRWK